MNDKKMIVAYGRLSEEDLEKKKEYSVSIYNQLSLIKEYAKRMKLSIDKEYIDDGYSGINFDRPGFEKMKEDIEAGKISMVITKDMSRLGREFIDTAYYISEYFPKHNIRYIAINDQYDSDNEDDSTKDIMVNVRSIINDRFVKDTSIKRTKTAMLKTNNGEYIGFIAPYGYKIVKKDGKRTLEIDEYASSVVKRIFTSIASGKTRNEVAEELNKDKVIPPVIYMKITPSRNKKYYYDWSDKIIYRILKNKTYTGATIIRKSIKKNYKQNKRTVVPIRDRDVKENTHPAIISLELFNEANSRIKTIKRKEKNNYDGTFSGLVICGECGRIMTACRVKRNNGNIQYYFLCNKIKDRKKCSNRIIYDTKLRRIIEDTLKNLVNDFVDDEEIINNVTKKLVKKDRINLKIANINQNIKVHDNNIRNLYLKKTKGELTLEEFIKEKNKETEMKNIQEENLRILIEKRDSDYKKNEVISLYNQFINGEIYLKEYIKDIIEKIIVYKDSTVQIVFKFGVGNTKKIKLYSMEVEMKRRNVAYIRVAHKNDEAIELQKHIIEEFANAKNIKIDYYYIDNGYSGTNINRPELRQLLRDIKNKKVTNTVIFKDITRLSRIIDDVSKIVKETSKRNVELLSTTNEETLFLSVLGATLSMKREDELNRKIQATKFYKNKELECEKSR